MTLAVPLTNTDILWNLYDVAHRELVVNIEYAMGEWALPSTNLAGSFPTRKKVPLAYPWPSPFCFISKHETVNPRWLSTVRSMHPYQKK